MVKKPIKVQPRKTHAAPLITKKEKRKKRKADKNATMNFFSREEILKLLNISLQNFRRLCIFKGIQPASLRSARNPGVQTPYYTKDAVTRLIRDPLTEILKAHESHIRLRNKYGVNFNQQKKYDYSYSLDHIIKERYPTFERALIDLDDALTLAHFFSYLHNDDSRFKLDLDVNKIIRNCQRLCAEFRSYVSQSSSLRKIYATIKGYFYEANINGMKIVWSVPHKYVQHIHDDVDANVLLYTIEIYQELLKFINYRLFSMLGMQYPGKETMEIELNNKALNNHLQEKDSMPHNQLKDTIKIKNTISSKEDEEIMEIDTGEEEGLIDNNNQKTETQDPEQLESQKCQNLFKNLIFFISRECPFEPLIFTIQSFGGFVVWNEEDSIFMEEDKHITHHIMDRPGIADVYEGREYIQPQWVFDCCNARLLLPTELYTVNVKCPPHLSPFVDNVKEGYIPDYAQQIDQIREESLLANRNEEDRKRDLVDAMENDPELRQQVEIDGAKEDEREYREELDNEMGIEVVEQEQEEEAETVGIEKKKTVGIEKKKTVGDVACDMNKMSMIMISRNKKKRLMAQRRKERMTAEKIQNLEMKKELAKK